jgi:hypothetical protein
LSLLLICKLQPAGFHPQRAGLPPQWQFGCPAAAEASRSDGQIRTKTQNQEGLCAFLAGAAAAWRVIMVMGCLKADAHDCLLLLIDSTDAGKFFDGSRAAPGRGD